MTLPEKPDRLPPLTALRAFEAAARLMSFAQAAEELSVTPAALSYQIRQLETHLGLPLFHRLNRAVRLTEAGRLLQPGVAEGFGRLRTAVRALDGLRDGRGLTITAGPAFTAKWLAPRLYHFVAAHPEVEVRLAATLRVLDFDRDGVDAAIRFKLRDDPALFSEPLIRDCMTPLCAPSLAAGLRDLRDMATAPLIHDDTLSVMGWTPEWGDWLAAAGVDRPDWRRGARFSSSDHALAAAVEGGAVILARTTFAAAELRDGRLTAPFDLGLDPEAHFHFVCPRGTETRPPVAAFRAWLRTELDAAPAPLPNLRVVRSPRLIAAAAAA